MTEKQVYVKSWGLSALEIFLYFFLAALTVSFFAMIVTKSTAQAVPFLLLSLLSFWVLLVDYKVKSALVFLLAHLPLVGIVFLPTAPILRLVCGIYAAGLIGYSMHRRRSGQQDTQDSVSVLVIGMVVIAIMYIVCSGAEILEYRGILLTSGIFFCMLYIAYIHAFKVDKALFAQNQDCIGQPLRRIRRVNRNMLRCFLAIWLLVMLAVIAVPWDDATGGAVLASALLRLLSTVIQGLALLFSGGSGGENSFVAEDSQESMGQVETTAPWLFWVIMEKILYIVGPLALLAAVGYGVYRFILSLQRRDRRRLRMELSEEEAIGETREFIPQEKKARPARRRLLQSLSNEEKVRRLFYRRIRKQMGKKVQRSDTPEQIEKKLPEEKLTSLVPLYDQARYSEEPISDEAWRKLGEKEE